MELHNVQELQVQKLRTRPTNRTAKEQGKLLTISSKSSTDTSIRLELFWVHTAATRLLLSICRMFGISGTFKATAHGRFPEDLQWTQSRPVLVSPSRSIGNPNFAAPKAGYNCFQGCQLNNQPEKLLNTLKWPITYTEGSLPGRWFAQTFGHSSNVAQLNKWINKVKRRLLDEADTGFRTRVATS